MKVVLTLCVFRLIHNIGVTFRGILIFEDSINSCFFLVLIRPIYFVTRLRKGRWNFDQLQLVGLGCHQSETPMLVPSCIISSADTGHGIIECSFSEKWDILDRGSIWSSPRDGLSHLHRIFFPWMLAFWWLVTSRGWLIFTLPNFEVIFTQPSWLDTAAN